MTPAFPARRFTRHAQDKAYFQSVGVSNFGDFAQYAKPRSFGVSLGYSY